MISIASFLCIVFIASAILTGLIRRYALNTDLLDIPNQRSSHKLPTPRAGGLAIVIIFISIIPALVWMDKLSYQSLWSFWGGGLIVALVGFWDDHRHIPPRWRLLAHFTGAAFGYYGFGGLPPSLISGSLTLNLGWIGDVLGLLFLVWMINLYNFMDGIDGIAGIEAITVCLGGVILYLITNSTTLWVEPALLAAAVAGFLWWNFPPAKIFMGDAGSGFLGIILGLFSIQAAWVSPPFFWSWMILLGVFIVDATVTLIRRYFRHEKVYEAHCSHAYQHAARHYQKHKPVSLAVGAINIAWLLPIALAVGIGSIDGFWGLLIAYFPLILLAFHFKAGVRTIKE